MTMRRIAVTVEVDVDLDDYADTYGAFRDEEAAERDAAEYLERIASDALKQQIGEHKTLSWGEVLRTYAEGVNR